MKILKRKRIIIYFLSLILLGLLVWYGELILYGIEQGRGQFRILWNTKTPEKFLAQGNYSDSLKVFFKKKLDLIEEIKQFAIDSLGLRPSKSYQKIYDQENRSLLWTISASEEFALEPKEWNYGFLGSMPYKGYFDSLKAYRLVQELEEGGYDVNIYNPAAWSTLGWFNDPILSSMLYWSEGGLASLIIHEMTHATIWISGNVEYNENLADFVGDQGALLFLAQKYGKNSDIYRDYAQGDQDAEKFYAHILRGTEKLDSLYRSFRDKESIQQKRTKKNALIQKIVQKMDTIRFRNPERYQKYFEDKLPNNAYFMLFKRYRAKQNQFEQEFRQKFGSNFKKYLAYLKEKYAS
ncbi:MAG: aminopeptidase [Microscillaceae bacterium]|nr:aminopeptidase [Microscillaceae bacterium]